MKFRPLSIASVGIVFLALTASMTTQAPGALKKSEISPILSSAANSKVLANPGMILLDPTTGETIFANSSTSLRKPASLLKLLSATALLTYVKPEYKYSTELLLGHEQNTLVIIGSLDPWMEQSNSVATKMGRVSLPKIFKTALAKLDLVNGEPIKNLQIEYANFYEADLAFLKAQFKSRNIVVTTLKTTTDEARAYSKESIIKFQSPPLKVIMDWMLLWSDNTLGDRMAMQASLKAGFGYSQTGIEKVFKKTLANLNIDSTGLKAVDGSGLSKENRVSAKLFAELLYKTYKSDRYQTIYGGLPIAGVNGTMRNRFINSAPAAVGLVRAKTGTLNGTVSMAGYVQSGDREYVFVAIADQISRGTSAAKSARAALDKVIAKFAKPLINASPSPSGIVENLDGTLVTSNSNP
jgi:D-alanyl-D-alanine carboxypeptidase